LHVANEMDAPCGDRQEGRQGASQGGSEPGSVLGALPLRWSRAIQGGRTVVEPTVWCQTCLICLTPL
jgi:hypothetical protein